MPMTWVLDRVGRHIAAYLQRPAAGYEPFTPADLPGDLDDEGRLVLVRRLVREGFLVISGAVRESGADAEA